MTINRNLMTATAVALILTAAPIYADEFYVGGSISSSTLDSSIRNGRSIDKVNTNAAALFAGYRKSFNSEGATGFYAGLELQLNKSNGFYKVPDDDGDREYENFGDTETNLQGELHLGYKFNKFRIYGFIGAGNIDIGGDWVRDSNISNIKGIGVEYNVNKKLAVRAEAALSEIQIDACSDYDVDKKDISVGLLYKF